MFVLTKVDDIQSEFGKRMRELGAAYYVLRAVCDPRWFDLSDANNAKRFRRHLRGMYRGTKVESQPPLIQTLCSDRKSNRQATSIRELRALIHSRKFEDRTIESIGRRWAMVRMEFENFHVKRLPRHFRERMAVKEDVIRSIRVLWFQPRSERARSSLNPWIRDGFVEGFGWPASLWEHVRDLLRHKLLRPCWPDVHKAIVKMNRVCRECRIEDKTEFTTTDAQIQDEILGIIRQHQPEGVDEHVTLVERVADGDLVLSPMLRSRGLQAEVISRWEPGPIEAARVQEVLDQLVSKGILERRVIEHGIYYFTSAGRGKEKPRWDSDLSPSMIESSDRNASGTCKPDLHHRLLDAIALHGKDAKPMVIIKEAHVTEQKGRKALRKLEDLGEYDGFARPIPQRYATENAHREIYRA